MKLTALKLPGVRVLEPRVFADPRGALFEAYRRDVFDRHDLPPFVQENQSRSLPETLRGLHYQLQQPQGKLVRVVAGTIFDVAVDIRRGSPTFGQWVSEILSADNHRQLYVPPGFAHGFCVMGDEPANVLYKCTDYYSGADDQRGVAWDDPGLGIPWPVAQPVLSDKDRRNGPLDASRDDLPGFAAV